MTKNAFIKRLKSQTKGYISLTNQESKQLFEDFCTVLKESTDNMKIGETLRLASFGHIKKKFVREKQLCIPTRTEKKNIPSKTKLICIFKTK